MLASEVGGHREVYVCSKANSLTGNQGTRVFTDKGRELYAETAQSSLTVIFRLVTGGLTSDMLVALGTASLQFQHSFVPISLWPVLGIVAAPVLGTVWSS